MHDIIVGRSQSDVEKLGNKGTVLLGKHYIKMGQTTSLSNNIYLDVTRSHVVFICGKRGGGKCLSGDSLISLHDGRLIPIKDLEQEQELLMCMNDQLKINRSYKSDFYK